MGHFYSETQFGKDLELNVVRIWVLHRVSLPKPANSLSRKEHLLRSGGSGALATLWGHICPLRQRREVLSSYLCPPQSYSAPRADSSRERSPSTSYVLRVLFVFCFLQLPPGARSRVPQPTPGTPGRPHPQVSEPPEPGTPPQTPLSLPAPPPQPWRPRPGPQTLRLGPPSPRLGRPLGAPHLVPSPGRLP